MNVPVLVIGLGASVLLVLGLRKLGGSSSVHSLFSRPMPTAGRVAVVGDSITEGGFSMSGGYVRVLRQAYPGLTFDNYGVQGNSTRAMWSRAVDIFSARGRYQVAIVMGGLNDSCHQSRDTIYNLSQIYQLARSSGAYVVALTETPVMPWYSSSSESCPVRCWDTGGPCLVRQTEVRQWLLGGAEGRVDRVVDVWTPLRDQRYFTEAGLHLNGAGQTRLGQVVLGVLR